MTRAEDIVGRRMVNQGLVGSRWARPEDVVAALGAVQAQDYPGARWAVGQRAPKLKDADVERAFDRGAILRTHVMRPTWHFVAPADIRWLLALVGPRVHAVNAFMYRQTELDGPTLAKGRKVLERALRDRTYLTRLELAAALARAGVVAASQRLAYLVMHAELDALICSGPRRGNQLTYALLEERVQPVPPRSREEALAELVRRYFTSHGPATVRDFVWWSGLTARDAKAGLAMVGREVVQERHDDREYWVVPSPTKRLPPSPRIWLLPNYDELGIAYRDRGVVPDVPRPAPLTPRTELPHLLFVDRRLVGRWRRTPERKAIRVDVQAYRRVSGPERDALDAAVQAFGTFVDGPVTLSVI